MFFRKGCSLHFKPRLWLWSAVVGFLRRIALKHDGSSLSGVENKDGPESIPSRQLYPINKFTLENILNGVDLIA